MNVMYYENWKKAFEVVLGKYNLDSLKEEILNQFVGGEDDSEFDFDPLGDEFDFTGEGAKYTDCTEFLLSYIWQAWSEHFGTYSWDDEAATEMYVLSVTGMWEYANDCFRSFNDFLKFWDQRFTVPTARNGFGLTMYGVTCLPDISEEEYGVAHKYSYLREE